MKQATLAVVLVCVGLIGISCSNQKSKQKTPNLSTPWTENVNASNPFPGYPRPIQQRGEWRSLNGFWEVSLEEMSTLPFGEPLNDSILVPFAVESYLSGQMKSTDHLVYRKEITIPKNWSGQEIILHFEGVDYTTKVFVNGQKVGEHKGAFDPFEYNITPYLTDSGKQEIIVQVHDTSNDGLQPVGKQVREPEGIFYTSTTGIWQTVWMEPVNKNHINDYLVTTDIDEKKVFITAGATYGGAVKVSLLDNGRKVASASGMAGDELSLKVRDQKLWSPEDPFLYDLKVELIENGDVVDSFESYVAMRKISLGKEDGITKLFLNNQPYFQVGVLDQGYWPDGLMTPATEEAFVWDIQTLKDMGMNLLRKHAKTEPQRWYYLCDTIGMLVWQDMPQAYPHPDFLELLTDADKAQFKFELENMIHDLRNYPSIVMWVIFNEGWGQHDTESLTKWVENMDETRLVSNASGWTDHNVGDIIDMHSYPGPDVYPTEEKRATVLGEFGGLGLPVEGHLWQSNNWGYRNMGDAEEFKKSYTILWDKVWKMKEEKHASAVVYTQVSDVEGEVKGLVTYDRKVTKIPVDYLHKIHTDQFVTPVEISADHKIFINNMVVSMVNRKGEDIYYTTDGSEPTTSSNRYHGPVTLTETATLKAVSAKDGELSYVTEATFEKVDGYQKGAPISEADLNAGLSYEVYEGNWQLLPDFDVLTPVKTDVTSSFDIERLRLNEYYYGLIFEGYVKLPKDDIYEIHLDGDDGVRLFIDGENILENDGIHGMSLITTEKALASGYHKVRLEYFQGVGGSGLVLEFYDHAGKKLDSKDLFYHN